MTMSVLASIRSQLAPVHREGLPFVGIFAVVSLLAFWLLPPLGGLGRRLLARIIDGVMIFVLCGLLLGWFIDWNSRAGEVTISLTFGLVYWVYESLMLSRDGQTVGKKVTKVRVARLVDGQVPTAPEAWGRAAVG